MAIAQSWQRKWQGDLPYGSALKQGTGWNPIHADGSQGKGRNIAPAGTAVLVPEQLTSDDFDLYGYTSEDQYLFGDPPGYGAENSRELGIDDRPEWGQDEGTRQMFPSDYPSWGPVNDLNGSSQQLPVGIPGGTLIRAQEKGAVASNTANVLPDETVNQGWLNKTHGDIEDSVIPDPSQLIIQSSAVQRDKVRAGSQISGTASEYEAPIKSRITGMKVKTYTPADQPRHYDMAPKQQEYSVRPFWLRTAGTGDPAAMQANEMYVSEPMQRTVPSDAYQGPVLPQTESVPNDPNSGSYGFTAEDAVW